MTNGFVFRGNDGKCVDRVPVSEPRMPPNGGTPWLQGFGASQKRRYNGPTAIVLDTFRIGIWLMMWFHFGSDENQGRYI